MAQTGIIFTVCYVVLMSLNIYISLTLSNKLYLSLSWLIYLPRTVIRIISALEVNHESFAMICIILPLRKWRSSLHACEMLSSCLNYSTYFTWQNTHVCNSISRPTSSWIILSGAAYTIIGSNVYSLGYKCNMPCS